MPTGSMRRTVLESCQLSQPISEAGQAKGPYAAQALKFRVLEGVEANCGSGVEAENARKS